MKNKIPISVLHVIDHLGYGGAPIVLKNIVENVNDKEIDVSVCALRTNPCPMPVKGRIISLKYHRYDPRTILHIARLCEKHGINILHVHLEKSTISSLLATFFCNVKVIVHEHGPILLGGTGFIYRLLLKLLCRRASAVIANSSAAKAALLRIGFDERSIRVVHNFIDPSQYNPQLYDRDKCQNSLGLFENETVVGFVGRLHYCKGVDLLIDAAAQLSKKENRYRFVIVGDGREKPRLEKQVLRLGLKEKVIFTGLRKNPAEIIRAFDIAVVPSRTEAFGIVTLEFMRMGIAVIASSAGGLVELVQNEKTGILLSKLEPETIAKAITRLAQNRNLREDLAKNAEVFSRKFDGREQLKQITDIYEKLCS